MVVVVPGASYLRDLGSVGGFKISVQQYPHVLPRLLSKVPKSQNSPLIMCWNAPPKAEADTSEKNGTGALVEFSAKHL